MNGQVQAESTGDSHETQVMALPSTDRSGTVSGRQQRSTMVESGGDWSDFLSSAEFAEPSSIELTPPQDFLVEKKLLIPDFNRICQAFTIGLPPNHNYSVEEIEDVLEDIMNNHDMLRCTMTVKDKVLVEEVGDAVLPFQDMRETVLPEKSLLPLLVSGIDIENGPAWRVVLHSGHKLSMALHLLIADPKSCALIAEEFCTLLTGGSLRQVPCSYAEWVEYLHRYAEENATLQAPFWEKMVGSHRNEYLTRPSTIDWANPATCRVIMTPGKTSILVAAGKAGGSHGLRNIVLGCLARALFVASGEAGTSVGLYQFLRHHKGDIDVSMTIGNFSTAYAVWVDGSDSSLEEIFKRVAKTQSSLPDDGIGFSMLAKTEVIGKILPQVGLFFVEDEEIAPTAKLGSNWSFNLLDNRDLRDILKYDQSGGMGVFGGVHPTFGLLGFELNSLLPKEKLLAVSKPFRQALDEAAKILSNNPQLMATRKGFAARLAERKKAKAASKFSSSKRRPRGVSIRPSRIMCNFQQESVVDNPYIFFVHPARSDASIYKSLAELLIQRGFNAKGIDSDVLTSIKQYEMAGNLKKLAKFYADLVLEALGGVTKSNDAAEAPIFLFGWELGGKIALETAVMLEKKGRSRILVYLLDTYLDLASFGVDRESHIMARVAEFMRRKSRLAEGQLESHQRVSANEAALADQPLSGTLKQTRVILIKAGRARNDASEAQKRSVKSFDNGLSQSVRKLAVLELSRHDHHSILCANEEITKIVVENAGLCRIREDNNGNKEVNVAADGH